MSKEQLIETIYFLQKALYEGTQNLNLSNIPPKLRSSIEKLSAQIAKTNEDITKYWQDDIQQECINSEAT